VFGDEAYWLHHVLGWFRTDVLTVIDLVLAVLITGHVLLRKREIGSSIGWIGLTWLSPILGSTLYFMFGVNRVKRRAQRLRDRRLAIAQTRTPPPFSGRDDHLSALEEAVGRITGRPAETGNHADIFQDGDNAYPVMLQAIAEAKRSIALSSYIFFADSEGERFIAALIAAHDRGVQVRVIVDGIGSGYFTCPVGRQLRAHGVPVARFMHTSLPWRMPFLNLRSHKKILVVDGRVGFTGGMNISAANVLATHPPEPVRDMHFRFVGPVVAQLVEAFARDWSFETEEDLDGEIWYPELAEAGGGVARVITAGPDQDLEKIEFAVMQAIACARRSIKIMTPYFLPDDRLLTTLAMAAVRGVAVDVVIPAVSDHPMMDWSLRANVTPLLAEGCCIWLNPPPFEHTKLMVIDDLWCLIGSSNWDMRSFRLNFELNVEVYHDGLAERLDQVIRSKQVDELTMIALEQRLLPTRLRDAAVRLMLPYL